MNTVSIYVCMYASVLCMYVYMYGCICPGKLASSIVVLIFP